MKRILLFIVAVVSVAQYSREDARAAYRAWREADPRLESDAAAGGAAIAQRSDRLAAEAAKYSVARKALLEGLAQDEEKHVAWLDNAGIYAESPAVRTKPDSNFIVAESAAISRTITKFAADPDKGIQQLRVAMEKERLALNALSSAVAEREAAAAAIAKITEAAEAAREKSLSELRPLLDAAKNSSLDTAKDSAAWVEYYRKIGEGAQGVAVPITIAPPGVPTVTLTNPVPAPSTVTPLPLARYTGAWTFPATNGLFHGPQPEFVEVLVHDENGQAKGTAFGRFKLPAGNTGDPVVRFDFGGPFQTTRTQKFPLVTSDGATGTIELIPGPAFNLLEVNFQTEEKPGKIHQADVVLVKK